MLGLLLLSIVKSIGFQVHDFGNYYYGGKLLIDGQFSTEVYNADDFNTIVKDRYTDKFFGAYYPNPPSLALLFAPLTVLSAPLAKLLLQLVSVLVFILSLRKLIEHWQLPTTPLLIVPIVFAYPIYNCILFGQPYLIIVGLIIYGYLHLISQANSKYLYCLPFAILMKVSPLVLLSIPLLGKQLKHLALYASLLIVIGLLSLLWIDPSTWLYFGTDVMSKTSNGILYNGFAVRAESLPVFLRILFLEHPIHNPDPLVSSQLAFIILFALIKAGLYTLGIGVSASRSISTKVKVSTWLILLLLLSPNISSYGLLYLIFPFLYLIADKKIIPVIPTSLLFFTSIYQQEWFETLPFIFQFGKLIGITLFLMYFLYHNALYKVLLTKWLLILFAALMSIFIGLSDRSSTGDTPGRDVLPNHQRVLLSDFSLSPDGILTTINHTVGKYDTITIQLPHQSYQQIKELSSNEYQEIDYLKTLTQSGQIRKVIKADQDVYFMTDAGRAPGFYTIKQLKTSDYQ